ncbi:unnamed protein product, partial [Chrysoparadoxa australica]
VVVKHTPYEQYSLMKAQGKAPLALRWMRLKNRFMAHRSTVDGVKDILSNLDVKYKVVGREELDRQHIEDVDLVIAVGGDGTVLSSSHFLNDSLPLLGVNSDPTLEHERGQHKKTDERRSMGALCLCTAENMKEQLPKILQGEIRPHRRSRIQAVIKSTFTETKLPPALNDILIAHPEPAAVSRFKLGFYEGEREKFSLNVWSSGLWICTATGSTAAMKAAGGFPMQPDSRDLQYMVREHLFGEGAAAEGRKQGHGKVKDGQRVRIRWNSLAGYCYVDGAHAKHPLMLGDEIELAAVAPPLWLFSSSRWTMDD